MGNIIDSKNAISTTMALIAIIIIAAIAGGVGYYGGNLSGYSAGYEAGSRGAYQQGFQAGLQQGNSSGYSKGYQAALEKAKPILPDVIKIGQIQSLSGGLGPFGTKIAKGAQLAVDEVNARGGIRGRRIQLITEDDATDPTRALEVAKKLVEVDGVQVIIGTTGSAQLRAIAPYLIEKKVLIISPSVSGPFLSTDYPNSYVMRTCASDVLQGAVMGDLVLQRGYKRVAYLIMDNAYGRGICAEVKKKVGEGVATIFFDEKKLDYRTELEQVKAANPDVVVHVGYPEDATVMFKQALEAGLEKVQWISAEGVYGTAMFPPEGDPAAAEFMSIAVIGTAPTTPGGILYEEFARRYTEAFGMEPMVYCDTCYDATMLAIQAIAYCGEYNGTKIRDAVLTIARNYIGPSGHKIFQPNGVDMMYSYYIIWDVEEVSPGKYEFKEIGRWP
jgi:ABC-type branched-subunit amino acid transport system substrate-binding protein